MDFTTVRIVFSLLCFLGFIAIATGTFLEVGRHRRGEGVIGPRHFRWRMVSASLWIIILLSLAYGTMFEWPKSPQDEEGKLRMFAILMGAMLLMVIAMGLFGVDLMLTMKARQMHRGKFSRNLNTMATQEIDRVRRERDLDEGGDS